MNSQAAQRFVRHVTLQTGHTRQSWRHEVDPEVLPLASALLERALAGERVPIPGADGCEMTAASAGRCCLVTAWRGDAPLVTTGIAAHSRCGAELWRRLHDAPWTPLATAGTARPPEPWCAALLQPGLALHPSAAHWLGDYERVMAWAFLSAPDR